MSNCYSLFICQFSSIYYLHIPVSVCCVLIGHLVQLDNPTWTKFESHLSSLTHPSPAMAFPSKTVSIVCVTILVLSIILCCILPFNCALGYKKLLKGILLGALLSKHKQDEHHYFYPVYHGMPA